MPLKDGSYKGPHWSTRRTLLEMLKTEGALSSQQMAASMGVSPMAVRQHMQELQKVGDVIAVDRSRGKGRPTKFWSLAPRAERHFPDRHRDLILDLLRSVRRTLGEEALESVLDEREEQQVAGYSEKLSDCSDLESRVERLAQIRSEEGYMAEARLTKDGAMELIENHCPICSAAAICSGLCSRELQVFERVLGSESGSGVEVERFEHMLSGGRRCAYRIRRR